MCVREKWMRKREENARIRSRWNKWPIIYNRTSIIVYYKMQPRKWREQNERKKHTSLKRKLNECEHKSQIAALAVAAMLMRKKRKGYTKNVQEIGPRKKRTKNMCATRCARTLHTRYANKINEKWPSINMRLSFLILATCYCAIRAHTLALTHTTPNLSTTRRKWRQ